MSTRPPLSPRDAFLLGYLVNLVGLHFSRLSLLETAREGASPELAQAVAQKLAELPKAGPEVVSRVFELEAIVASRGVRAPGPPRTPAEYQAWAQALSEYADSTWNRTSEGEFVLHPDEGVRLPLWFGRRLGDLRETLALEALLAELAPLQPGRAWFSSQAGALQKGRAQAIAALSSPPTSDAQAIAGHVASHARVAVEGLSLRPGEAEGSPGARARQLSSLHAVARSFEDGWLGPGPQQAVRDLRAGKLDERAVLRALLRHDAWATAVHADLTDGRPHMVLHGGSRAVRLFSAPELRDAELRAPGAYLLEGPGYQIFTFLPDGAGLIEINPGSDVAFPIDGARAPELRDAARSAAVERALLDWTEVDAGAVRAHDGYGVVLSGESILHQPVSDALGRQFAAVFTGVPELRRFLEGSGKPLGPGQRLGTAPASRLFQALRRANAPGIAINPAGPVRPRTFSAGFLALMAGG